MSKVNDEPQSQSRESGLTFQTAFMGENVSKDNLLLQSPNNNYESQDKMDMLMKASQTSQIQSSSLQTIFAITNSMVGSVCLVLPLVFKESGIISSLIVMIVLALVQFKTCSLIVRHQTDNEIDFQEQIFRILGNKWTNFYRLASGTYLFIVGIVYFLLVNKTCYPILVFMFTKFDYNDYAKVSDGPTFNKFSIQYQSMILFIPLSFMLLFKNISQIIKIAKFGIVALVAYVLFIIYVFLTSISSQDFNAREIKLFTWDFVSPAGQFCLAFLVHNTMGQMINCNMNKDKNVRDLGLSYLSSAIIYAAIGIFGAIGIVSLEAQDPQTILDYFGNGDAAVLIIESVFLIHLFTAFPIFNFISRYSILNVFYPNQNAPKHVFYGFSAVYILVCLTCQLVNIDPKEVIGINLLILKISAFDGAVCGFFLVYLMPITIHLKCYYSKNNTISEQIEENTLISHTNACNYHSKIDNIHKNWRFLFYFALFLVGSLNLILQIVDIFVKKD